MVLDEVELEKYKKHPRVLEVRFILLFNLIEREYGYHQTIKMFSTICSMFNCNMTFLQGIINRRFDIQRNSKTKWKMWRQEVIFTATCYEESIYKVATQYLNVKPHTLYMQSENYDINNFCNNEWLEKLDNQTVLCGEPVYRLEVIRFFEAIDMFANVLNKWKGDK